MDYAALRKRMVEEQLIPRGISDKRVLETFHNTKRHKFVPGESQSSSYGDFPIPVGEGQTISQPYMVALMTECLGLKGNEKILEIGTGSGYQTAVLAQLGREVYTIERFETLSKKAQNTLELEGYRNIFFKIGDGTLGWPEYAPYDRIMVTAAGRNLPLPLIEQLEDGGKIVIPLGESFSQMLTLIEKNGSELKAKNICSCVFVPLVGKFGWKNN